VGTLDNVDPRTCADNAHESVLTHEMTAIEPTEILSRTIAWTPLAYLMPCNTFSYDPFGDHLQTCQTKSAASQVHDWVVYKLGVLLGSVGHRVKIHNITPVTGKERGDLEIKDYVVMQKPQPQATRFPPPHTLIMDYTMTQIRFGCSHLHPMGQLTNTRRHPDPIAFLPLAVDTTGRMYDEFIRLLFCTLTVRHRIWLIGFG
jgi:hypothetical protein